MLGKTTTDKTLSYLLILTFIGVSILVPYFSIIAVLIMGYLFFKANIDPTIQSDFNNEALSRQEKFHAFLKLKKLYLASWTWKAKRERVLERDHYKCVICNSTAALHIHHKSGYNQIPTEPISCLVTLCAHCHKDQHKKVGYPATLEEYMEWDTELAT